ncbi:MAG: class I SAM-dependent methyltransferase [Candidatus Micrarchaeia archaeon]
MEFTQNLKKYQTRNPLQRLLLKKFFKDLDSLLLPLRKEIKTVLEIGCGEGFVTKHIHDLGFKIVGADISDEVLRIAREMFPEIEFLNMDIYELDKFGKWDLIVCCEVLEHLKEPEKALKAMMKASNYILISVPNEPFFRIANICRLKYLKNLGNTPGHINHWSMISFKKFLKQFNFRETKFKISTLWQLALCRV